jgi:DNA helicase-2/ATP-dependent DNA helicase PcrA
MKSYTLRPLEPDHSSLPDSFDAELNPAQRDAVYFDEGPLLLIAGAGSGKTKTLVYRVARLVSQGVAPESILLLTFTRKAAQEMLNRAASILDNRCREVSGGTFHGFGNIILRQFADRIGFNSQFTILDRGDAEDLINVIRKEQKWATNEKRFPKKSTIATVISKSINTGKPIATILDRDFPQFSDFLEEITTIANEYPSQKRAMNVMDYDDLLVKTLELLKTCPEVREALQQRYAYIMVDEYQDTNTIQAQLIHLLTNRSCNIMVVGDDSQSIYSFRGADFKNIMEFPELFPEAKIIKLEQNYRSTQPILDLTNALIEQSKEKFTKRLFTEKTSTKKPVYIETANDNHQSRFICQKILELREEGRSLSDIAVLMRSGWHSNDLEVELKAHNIPFVKHGGFKFVESAHVKDVIAYLKLMYNPNDVISWHRVLLLFDGLGPKGAATLTTHILSHLSNPSDIPLASYKKKAYFSDVMGLLTLIFNPKNQTTQPTALVEAVLTYYLPIFKLSYDNFTKRQTDLDSLSTIAEKYISLETLLSELSLDPPSSTEDVLPEDSEDEHLTLSTIHSAKGLEWHTVFLISAVDGYLPSFQSLGDALQLEEERRLMYVALTRAEDQLFIIKPNLDLSQSNYYRYSGIQFSNPSRFLGEAGLLKQYMEQWAVHEEATPSSFGFPPPSSQNKKHTAPTRPLYPGHRHILQTDPSSTEDLDMNQSLSENDFDADRDRRRYSF